MARRSSAGSITLGAALLLVFSAGCERPVDCSALGISEGGEWECLVPGWARRPFLLYTPAAYDPDVPIPLVLGIHGGGGDAGDAARATCPDGELGHEDCLHAFASREGFALVLPNGAARAITPNIRTYNAGGGSGGWMCVSGYACAEGIDDIAFMSDLLDEIASAVNIDPTRVYATGLSNGGAMSYRMACELSDRITAIAPVGSANQFQMTGDCQPARAVPVLHIHGTADNCWPYSGGPQDCVPGKDEMVSVSVSLEGDGGATDVGWVNRNGCDATPVVADLPDDADDGMTSTRSTWPNCTGGAEVSLITVTGGGHTWPGGYAYAPERAGEVTRDFSANEVIWEFFQRFSL